MELMSFNVSMKQVEPVIRSVLRNSTNLEIHELPKMSTLVSVLPEMKALAYKHLGEELMECSDATLHNHLVNIIKVFKNQLYQDLIL